MRRPFVIILSILFMLGMVLESSPVASAADPVPPPTSIDFPFDSTKTFDDPTADKPQSKLWYNDGSWWAVLNEKNSVKNPNNTWHIFKLAWPSTWNDTGVVVDDRPAARADVLWDNVKKKLYVGSTKSNVHGADSTNQGRLYRYSYANGAYTLDSGFPAVMFVGSVESTTIDKDSTGQIWVTFTKGSKVYVNRSLEDSAGVPQDASWDASAAFVVPNPNPNPNYPTPTTLASDDISSLIAFNGNIGVLWSNHNSPSAMYFAYHKDSDADLTWQSIEQIYTATCAADDHMNLKAIQADAQGRVFAAVKTSFGDSGCNGNSSSPLLRLVVRKAANSWSVATFGTVGDDHTRPVLLLDTSSNKVYMFATSPTSGCGKIYMKSASMDAPVFTGGKGTVFIDSTNANGASCVNNATSTKQTVNAASGLVVLASDHSKFVYAHNVLDLGGTPATSTPTSTNTPTNTPAATGAATNTPTSTPAATNTPTTAPAGGTRLKDVTFESGSLTGANGADAVVGTVALNSATPLKGSYAATINTTSGYLREDFTAADELFVSFYFKAGSFPASARLAQISNGSTTVGTIFTTTSGTLQLKNGSTTIGSASPALAAGTVYRIGLHQKKGTGANAVLEAYLATGDAVFGAPFASSAAQSFTTQATRFSLGATNSAAVNATVDTIQLDTAGFASNGAPAATNTPTSAPATATPTNTPTSDPAATSTPTDTPAATNTPTDTPAATNTPTDAPAATSTPTALPTNTPTTVPAGGTRLKDVTFEGGSLTGINGADAVVGTVALESAAPLKGSYAATINTTSGYLREDFTAADELFVSFYVRVNTRNTTSARLAQISNGSTTVGNIFLTTTGALQLKNNGTTIGTSTQTLALGSLYRVGLHQKKGAGGDAVLEVYLASGDAAFGAPILSNAAQSFTTQATRFSLGATNSNALNVTVDDIRLDTAVMP